MENKAWIVTANMGYGHQRTAYPLRHLSANGIINANTYSGIPDKDRLIWEASRGFYEFISRLKRVPLIGGIAFYLFDRYQRIAGYYPKRDLSKSDFNLRGISALIKKGWGENLIKTLDGNPLPLISTFFTPAFMAEHFKYSGDIYCVVCDADIARTWVPLNSRETRIKYFAPCEWAANRLKLYGIKRESIFLTGFPLPKENIGDNLEIVKHDFANRIINLDPKGRYRRNYDMVVRKYIGSLPSKSDHPLTLMFSIGGAGAQKEMCLKILKSLKRKLKNNEIKVIISTGIKKEVYDYILDITKGFNNVEIIFEGNIADYFDEFNKKLRKTDILWTKPSELSFYSGLGLPIIIAPSIGSQEDFNKRWLLHTGTGWVQENPEYTDQWLFDLLNGGKLAESAMEGFIEVEKKGTYNIERIINEKSI